MKVWTSLVRLLDAHRENDALVCAICELIGGLFSHAGDRKFPGVEFEKPDEALLFLAEQFANTGTLSVLRSLVSTSADPQVGLLAAKDMCVVFRCVRACVHVRRCAYACTCVCVYVCVCVCVCAGCQRWVRHKCDSCYWRDLID
jgi:hypothetical protein